MVRQSCWSAQLQESVKADKYFLHVVRIPYIQAFDSGYSCGSDKICLGKQFLVLNQQNVEDQIEL